MNKPNAMMYISFDGTSDTAEIRMYLEDSVLRNLKEHRIASIEISYDTIVAIKSKYHIVSSQETINDEQATG